MRDLTDQQATFVLHYTSTDGCIGNATAAARAAGYSEAHARDMGYQLLAKPHVRAAVDEANRRRLSGPAATKATAFLERVVDDECAPLKVRVEAAKTILDRAGFLPPNVVERAAKVNALDKPLHEMTLPELGQAMAHQEAMLRLLKGVLGRDEARRPLAVLEGEAVEVAREVVRPH
jgi:hypothetical protein